LSIRRLLIKGLIVLALGVLMGGLLLAWQFWRFWEWPVPRNVEVTLTKGIGLTAISRILEAQEVISSANWFFLVAHATRGAGFLQAGEYHFEAGLTPPAILSRLRQGAVIRHRLVVLEGWRLNDIGQAMTQAGLADAQTLLRDPKLPKILGLENTSLEGWLFPDTYFFTRDERTRTLLARMVRHMRVILDQEWANRPPQTTLTPYQTLILASIIEKETGHPMERGHISAVFHNRLRLAMRLQSDPTVIYGIPDFDGDITRTHLRTPTDYNTYIRQGLPPTPICSPGQAALRAALHPDQSSDLYFVARGDGTHAFSKTFREHRKNVDWYQRKRGKPPSQSP
jgi:UPF0755 protein